MIMSESRKSRLSDMSQACKELRAGNKFCTICASFRKAVEQMTTRVPAEICDDCNNPRDRETALKLIEFHKYRIEVICDHYGLDPQEWLADYPDVEH